mmetsp:Transcript_19610/g.28309  ORF Transcript_19610/g.28309 Transcript_19610/m.28309 type:complete len:97 (-) Transcript_19610:2274-2564(-)
MCLATWESTALRGSSIRYTSARWYTARARATRCFWPPERLIPLSPISVMSPAGRMWRSGRRAQASSTTLYHSWSYGLPNRMLSRRVALRIQATWAV